MNDVLKKKLLFEENQEYILPKEDVINLCQEGYRGFLCSSCDKPAGFYKLGSIVCKNCSKSAFQYVSRLFLIIIWFILACLYENNYNFTLIFSYSRTLKMNYKTKVKKYFFYTFKSSFNFFHIYTVFYFLFLPDWFDNMDKLLYIFVTIGTANLFDITCFFPNSSNLINNYFFIKYFILRFA